MGARPHAWILISPIQFFWGAPKSSRARVYTKLRFVIILRAWEETWPIGILGRGRPEILFVIFWEGAPQYLAKYITRVRRNLAKPNINLYRETPSSGRRLKKDIQKCHFLKVLEETHSKFLYSNDILGFWFRQSNLLAQYKWAWPNTWPNTNGPKSFTE